MVKAISFFKQTPGMAVEAFQAYWRTAHARVVVELPGIRRYVQSHTLLSGYRKGEPIYDGCAIGPLGRAVSESGRLRHGDGGHGRGGRRRRAFMLLV